MKPIELPVPRSSAVTLSPGKTEVKWNRTAESLFEPTFLASLTTNDTNHDDYDSGFSNERRRTSDSRTDTRDPHESTLGSIDEILKKFSNISALSMNGFNEHESEPTESYARLPDITINGNSEQKLDIKLNSYRSNSKSDEVSEQIHHFFPKFIKRTNTKAALKIAKTYIFKLCCMSDSCNDF